MFQGKAVFLKSGLSAIASSALGDLHCAISEKHSEF